MNSTRNFDLGHCGMEELTKCENGIGILDNRTRTIADVVIAAGCCNDFISNLRHECHFSSILKTSGAQIPKKNISRSVT